MSLDDAVDLCRRSHRLTPFCFYNGNPLVSIIIRVIKNLDLAPDTAAIVPSLDGHIVAGVATDEEMRAFRRFCDSLEGL